MPSSDTELVTQAAAGDHEAFEQLVVRYQAPLKSYLYRLMADREETDDLAQEVWLRVFNDLGSYAGQSSVRAWLFGIATRVATDQPRVMARWPVDAQDKAWGLTSTDREVVDVVHQTHWESPQARYEMREHIDFCFTCLLKTLPLEQHLAFLLCELYDLTEAEAAEILDASLEVVQRLLDEARRTLEDILQPRCGLINPQGSCHQCAEYNSVFNPYQDERQELGKLELVRAAEAAEGQDLFALRTALVRRVDPLHAAGTNLHEVLMQVVWHASGTS
jgi:RNA polymerase sigma-70 factor (ECF subfamily)